MPVIINVTRTKAQEAAFKQLLESGATKTKISAPSEESEKTVSRGRPKKAAKKTDV